MLHQTFLLLGQLWQLFEVSQILEFLRYIERKANMKMAELLPLKVYQIAIRSSLAWINACFSGTATSYGGAGMFAI